MSKKTQTLSPGDGMICSREQLIPQGATHSSEHKDVSKIHSSGERRAWRDQRGEHAVGYLGEEEEGGGEAPSLCFGGLITLFHCSIPVQGSRGGGGSSTSPHLNMLCQSCEKIS
jgi:hypothetical protein